MLGSLLDVFFPRRCVGCGDGGWPFCDACRSATSLLTPPGCHRCGRPFDHAVDRCRDCPPPAISWSRSAFLYDGPVRTAVMKLKFGGARTVAAALAPAVAELVPRAPPERLVLTWVPLGRRRRRERGYDQAEALAKAVAKLTGVQARPLLRRVVETAPQARRSGAERAAALEGAFAPRGRIPACVVLVDDVLTTGATAATCAEVLRRAGATEVGVLTAARSLRGRLPTRCYTPADSRLGLWLPGGRSPGSRSQPRAKRPT